MGNAGFGKKLTDHPSSLNYKSQSFDAASCYLDTSTPGYLDTALPPRIKPSSASFATSAFQNIAFIENAKAGFRVVARNDGRMD